MHSYRGIVNRLAAYTLVVCFNQLDSIGPDGIYACVNQATCTDTTTTSKIGRPQSVTQHNTTCLNAGQTSQQPVYSTTLH